MTPAAFTITLDAAQTTLAESGGKGINLNRMIRNGFPIPEGFIVTTAAYDAYIAANGLRPKILSYIAAADLNDRASLEKTSSDIRSLFSAPMPSDIEAAIRAAYRSSFASGDPALAVRSSATAEDLPGASFAGQQDTYLNIHGEDSLLDAVKRCWSSLWTSRALSYRHKEKIISEKVSLAVIVENLISAEFSGIMFTANPITGARDDIVINASWGLGEAIVGSLVVPDNIVYDKRSEKTTSIKVAEKTVMTVRTKQGTEEREVPENMRWKPVLNARQIAELANFGKKIEQYYGSPQDIEWAFAGGRFYIVQARDITSLPPEPLRWDSTGKGNWVHVEGTMELMIEPVSPLCATYLIPVYDRTIHDVLKEFKIESLVSWLSLKTVNGYMFYRIDLRPRVRYIAALPSLWRIYRTFTHFKEFQEKEDRQYTNAVAASGVDNVAELSTEELLQHIDSLLYAGMNYWSHISIIFQAFYRTENKFIRYYKKTIRRAGDPEAQVLLRGQRDLLPMRAERSIYGLSGRARDLNVDEIILKAEDPVDILEKTENGKQFLAALKVHLDTYGTQLLSYDPLTPTLTDDPRPIFIGIRTYLEGKESPIINDQRLIEQRDGAIKNIRARLSHRQWDRFQRYFETASNAAALRENTIFQIGLAWTPLRHCLLEIGKRLAGERVIEAGDDVFWLNKDEIIANFAIIKEKGQPVSLASAVADRKVAYERQKLCKPPSVIPADSKLQILIDLIYKKDAKQADKNTIVGLAVSPGTVTGIARVITSSEDMSRLNLGEILVAHTTTPAWTPLFSRASALVTDIGGPLAHGSIVAREYGIPAVMGTGSATQRIKDGQTISVDGTSGKVRIGSPKEN